MSEVDAKVDVAEQVPKMEESIDVKTTESSADCVMKDANDSEAVVEVKDKDVEVKAKDVEDKDKESAEAENKSEFKRTRTFENDRYQKSKYDPSLLPKSSDAQEIRRQVEFYFSDSNLLTDNHMKEQIQGEKNLPVAISHVHGFGRMKRYQPYSAVVAALRDSPLLTVTGSEGKELVQRKQPFDEVKAEADRERIGRSVYVKGFGDEEPTTQFDIETFFVTYGPTRQVRLRREYGNRGPFKGSAFAEFDTLELAQKFLNADPKPTYKNGSELIIKSREEYEESNKKQIRDGEKDPKQSRYNNYEKKGRGNYRGDNDDWNTRRENDRKNGFRGGRGGRGGRGRGDRNRGRGGRDDHRDSRRGRNDNGIPQIRDTTSEKKKEPNADKVKTESEPETKKRAREDDDQKPDAPSKKEKLSDEAKTEPVDKN